MTDPRAPITVQKLQALLGVTPDGAFGPLSRAALMATFTNRQANAVTEADLVACSARLGCTVKQLRAVAAVESSGGGFDRLGRPKILFERHLFHRLTKGRWTPTTFSQAKGGGYAASSWDKLMAACARDPDAAFGACSWGKFQVLGMHWDKLEYPSSWSLAWSTVQSEGDHYELLARYIEKFGLTAMLRKISANPEDCRPFALGYNGPAYERFGYHTKIAAAMR